MNTHTAKTRFQPTAGQELKSRNKSCDAISSAPLAKRIFAQFFISAMYRRNNSNNFQDYLFSFTLETACFGRKSDEGLLLGQPYRPLIYF
jgi:hypothetical protein